MCTYSELHLSIVKATFHTFPHPLSLASRSKYHRGHQPSTSTDSNASGCCRQRPVQSTSPKHTKTFPNLHIGHAALYILSSSLLPSLVVYLSNNFPTKLTPTKIFKTSTPLNKKIFKTSGRLEVLPKIGTKIWNFHHPEPLHLGTQEPLALSPQMAPRAAAQMSLGWADFPGTIREQRENTPFGCACKML